MRRALLSVVVFAFLGCGAGPEPEPAALSTGATVTATGSSRAEREAAASTAVSSPPETTAPSTGLAPAAIPAPAITLSRLEGTIEAEDGAGNVAPSSRAVAIDLRAEDFPPRALDPVLAIGALRLRHYRHPRIGVLRFVIASPDLLEDGAAVAVDYEDGASPTIVSPSLVVPAEVRR